MGTVTANCLLLLTFAYSWQFAHLKVPYFTIHGGSIVNINEVPFMAVFKNVDRGTFCGAVIVHTKLLLSAAHCSRNKNTEKSVIIVGTDLYSPTLEIPQEQYYEIKDVVKHPGNVGYTKDDLCVIILQKKLKFSDKIQPIGIEHSKLLPIEGEVTIYGFGETETGKESTHLRKVTMQIADKSECFGIYNGRGITVQDNTVCLEGELGMGACFGDSGGPAVYKGRLLGVISNGPPDPCADMTVPLIISHIPSMQKFVNNVMKDYIDTQCAFKIRGGSPAKITDAPYVASFKLEDKRFTCAATIVHEQFLLATAHCLQSLALTKGDLTITVGSETNDEGQNYIVEEIFIHPQFDVDNYDFDLAVVKLKDKLILSDQVKIIEMASSSLKYPKDGIPVTVYGFAEESESGHASLNKLTLPYYGYKQCENLYATRTDSRITSQMFCAGEPGQADTCAGDHGAPAIYDGVLLGISSWGNEACVRKYPSVFTYIPLLRSYIDDIIKEHSSN